MNLKGGKINGTGEFINVETELNLNLVEGKTYQVQIQGKAVFCESLNPSSDEGFLWNSLKPFGYEKESAYLWIKVNKGSSVYVNIAEQK